MNEQGFFRVKKLTGSGIVLAVWPPERTCSKLAGLKVLMNLARRAGGEDVHRWAN